MRSAASQMRGHRVRRARHQVVADGKARGAAGIGDLRIQCVSAWKKDPRGGVIGVQSGPLC
jgi:hypothetical protein